MSDDTLTATSIGNHGAARLPSVEVDSYNIELKDDEGFLGDRASKGAFQAILDGWRKPLRTIRPGSVRQAIDRRNRQSRARRDL